MDGYFQVIQLHFSLEIEVKWGKSACANFFHYFRAANSSRRVAWINAKAQRTNDRSIIVERAAKVDDFLKDDFQKCNSLSFSLSLFDSFHVSLIPSSINIQQL